jgi:magnesium-transporting ATPase (P-type)
VNIGTPLQRKLSRLALLLFGIAIVCAIIVLSANDWSSNTQVIIYAVATGLSMIPASLIVVLTITMAVGTKRMVKRNVIVRNLKSLEALGAVTDICSDKTGTLTQGRMVAKKCWIPTRGTYSVGSSNQPFNPTEGDLMFSTKPPSTQSTEKAEEGDVKQLSELLEGNTELEDFLKIGDPTEIAIQDFACRFGYDRQKFLDPHAPKVTEVGEYGFDSDVKKMSVIVEDNETKEQMIYTKGAVERVLESCDLSSGIATPWLI